MSQVCLNPSCHNIVTNPATFKGSCSKPCYRQWRTIKQEAAQRMSVLLKPNVNRRPGRDNRKATGE